MEAKLKEILIKIIKCVQRIKALKGCFDKKTDFDLKVLVLDCLIAEMEIFISELERFEEERDEDII